MVTIKFQKLLDSAYEPIYQSVGAAGADLCVALLPPTSYGFFRMYPGQITVFDTGLALEIPHGYEGQIRPRSGLGSKGITVVNTPGTIDSDYRGSVKIALINLGDLHYDIYLGDRIAQLVIAPVARAMFSENAVLEETKRGENGFGSTGVA